MSFNQDSQPSAIPFVYLHSDQFIVSQEAKTFLSQIKAPIAVLTIVGKYRTGKSLFLNRIMLGKSKAFKVSPTINSCTRGLWLWKDTLKFKNEEQEKEVLIIDTEGFGATEESDAYNNKILLFALLLSSYFVYNSVGSIDENSLNNISVLANLANEIQSKNAKDQNLQQNFPSFLWLVRDFTLHLVDKNDIPIQAKEYLEQALEIQKGTSNLIEGKNRIRRMMKHFFRDRDCFTLVRPVETQDKLQQLDTLEEEDFRATFLEQSRALKQKIFTKIKPKKLKNTLLTGQTFYQLAQNYVDVVNSNSLPNFQNSYKHLLKLEMCSLKRSISHQQESVIKGLLTSSIKSLKSLQDFESLKQTHISQVQTLAKQKIKTHHSLSAFMNSEQITILIGEIKTFVGGMFDKGFSAMKEEIRFKYVAVIDQMKVDNLMKRPLESVFTEKQLKEFIYGIQNNIIQSFEGFPVPDFMLTELTLQIFVPFKQQLIDQFNELNAKRLHESNHELKIKLQIKEQNLKDKEAYVKRVENELKQCRKMNSELQIKIVLVERELGMAKQQSIKNTENLSLTIDNLQRQKESLSIGSLELGKQLQIRNDQIYCLKKLLEQKGNETSKIEKELAIHKERLEVKSQESNERNIRIQKLQESLDKKTAEIDNLKEKIDQIRQSKEALYQNFVSTSQKLSQRLSQAQTLSTRQSTQLKQLKKHIEQQSLHHSQQISYLKQLLNKESTLNQCLTQNNTNLQQTVSSLELTVSNFYLKEQSYKEFKKCIKNSSSIQCLHCTRFFMSSIFFTHLTVCTVFNQREGNPSSALTRSQDQPMQFRVINVAVHENGTKPLTIYQLQCQKGLKKWVIEKKFTEFCEFNQNMHNSLPGIELSSAKKIFDPKYLSKKSFSIEDKQKIIEKYFNDLGQNPLIQSSKFWNEFIWSSQSLNQTEDSKDVTKRIALQEIKQASILNYQMRKNPIKDDNIKATENQRRQSMHTPEDFFKIWEQKQSRAKASSACSKKVSNE